MLLLMKEGNKNSGLKLNSAQGLGEAERYKPAWPAPTSREEGEKKKKDRSMTLMMEKK